MMERTNLLHVCSILNKYNVKYIICGAYACALNGHIRATNDIDIIVDDDIKNLNNVIKSIQEIFPNLREEISIQDIQNNVVLKIIDDIELDISRSAWKVNYKEAKQDFKTVVIEETNIPYLGLESLMRSKETLREIDQWDLKVLRTIWRDGKL